VRILYVLRYFPTLTETFVYREIGGLLARGHQVEVAAIGARADGDLQDELPDVVVHRPPAAPIGPELIAGMQVRSRLRLKDRVRASWLGGVARGFDRIHVHFAGEAAEWAQIAAAVAGVPFSVTVHAADLWKPRAALAEVLQAADRVITVAEHNRAALRERYRVDATVVRCGVDPRRYPPASPASPGPMRVVSVARWIPKKGLDRLCEAVDALGAPVALRLVADAPARVASSRVTIGALPSGSVPEALASAHLFALPCRVADDGDRDGVPVAMMEAMAAGLPVLTTAIAGIPELVDDEVGWIVPPDDAAALRAALEAAAADPEGRARRGDAGRRRIAERGFTVDAQVDGLLAAWGRA
jgi:colanic acid/amylovoran biosynthesis glycosyltransferase